MKNRIAVIAVLTIVLAAAAYLSLLQLPVRAETYELTVNDDFGRNITLKEFPTRIISLSPTITEILFAIGAGDRVVGVTEYCNYPEEELDITVVGLNPVNISGIMGDIILVGRLTGEEN
ncbi:MAG: hypothetical protein WBE22_05605 [Halobacteriota archaeon]